jgi:hypothetical protein
MSFFNICETDPDKQLFFLRLKREQNAFLSKRKGGKIRRYRNTLIVGDKYVREGFKSRTKWKKIGYDFSRCETIYNRSNG